MTAKIPKKISLVEKEVNDDGLLNAKEIAARVETSKSTVLSILYVHLNRNKVSKRCNFFLQFKSYARWSLVNSFHFNENTYDHCFGGCEGILMIDFKERNPLANGEYYASLLHKLKNTIIEKRLRKLNRGVKLVHDNASVHIAAIARAILDCNFIKIDHCSYSSDLVLRDYSWLFKLKSNFRMMRKSSFEAFPGLRQKLFLQAD